MQTQTSFAGRQWTTSLPIADLPSLFSHLLSQRGLSTPLKIQHFLSPSLADIPSPWQMRDMEKAVERITFAIAQNERIMVFGDFDADGITATVILVEGLKRLGANVSYRIPDRNTHSHGLKKHFVEEIAAQKVSLLLTCDCGTNDHEEVALAHKLGMDVIVTDHHESEPARFPRAAFAVLNPHLPSCPYPEKTLSGAGVAFKLISALGEKFLDDPESLSSFLAPFLEICTIGLVADCMNLLGENRILTKFGLELLKSTEWPGLQMLLERANIAPENIDADTIRFCIAPRLNAASRIGDVVKAVQLFLGDETQHAERIAQLEKWNVERQTLLQEALEQSFSQVRTHASCQTFHHIAWRPGVLGLVASRQVEMLRVPVICSTIREDGLLAASCRAPEGCSIISALRESPELFGQFGGHDGAAGFVTHPEKWEAIKDALHAYFSQIARKTSALNVDAWIAPTLLTSELTEFLHSLAPFGPGNSEPIFGLRSVQVQDYFRMGEKKNHLRISGVAKGRKLDFAAFFADEFLDKIRLGQKLDIAFTVSENFWNGEKRLQFRVEDLRETKK